MFPEFAANVIHSCYMYNHLHIHARILYKYFTINYITITVVARAYECCTEVRISWADASIRSIETARCVMCPVCAKQRISNSAWRNPFASINKIAKMHAIWLYLRIVTFLNVQFVGVGNIVGAFTQNVCTYLGAWRYSYRLSRGFKVHQIFRLARRPPRTFSWRSNKPVSIPL